VNDAPIQESAPEQDEETPWLSFSDAVTALLFVFIATTFWFDFQLAQARRLAEASRRDADAEVEKFKGADTAAKALLQGVGVCLAERSTDGVHVRPVVEQATHTMSIYIEPQANTIVEWFRPCSAEITPDAGQVVAMARGCLADEVPRLANDYTVLLTLEGHTDARPPGAGDCRERFPSNWELSGARAGAALRRLTCDDGECGSEASVQAAVLGSLSEDRGRLQLIAAGRAESVPAWRALCAADWTGAAVDPSLDAAVCERLADESSALDHRKSSVVDLVAASPIGSLRPGMKTFDAALVAWANDPRCNAAGNSAACEERFRRLRRVDMRVDLLPRASAAPSARSDAPPHDHQEGNQ
jgi:flagellar motor protein MotB